MKKAIRRIVTLVMVLCLLVNGIPSQLLMQANAVGGIDSLSCSSFITTVSHREYIDTMIKYYLNNNSKLTTALDNGKNVIFMFEGGSDNYPSYTYSTSTSSVRNQATCIVIKKNSSGNAYIAFYSENCSSVPCDPSNTGGGAYDGSTTLMDGIYGVYTTSHFGYGALQTTATTGYYTPSSSPDGWVNSANGINVHTRATNNPVGWSAGCQVIGTGAYEDNVFNEFMKVVAGIDYNVWYDYYNDGINGPPSMGEDMGYYVVDRQLALDGLSNLYNSTALSNITAFSAEAKEAAMNFYYNQCSAFPSYCEISVNSATAVMSQPCRAATDSSSELVSNAAAGTEYTATKLYRNTADELWYEVQLGSGEVGYISAADTGYKNELTDDIQISGAGLPASHEQGNSFTVSGNITSSYNQLSTVSAYIYTGFGTDGTPATGDSATVNGTSFSLAGSSIDNNTLFGDMAVGNHTYAITANYINYYATSGSAMSSNTGSIPLVREYFAVVAAASDPASCTHSYKDNIIKEASCLTTGTNVKVCTACGKVNETTVNATGHSFGAWSNTVEPTCLTDGIKTRTCPACGTAENDVAPATGHSYGTVVIPATCVKHEHTVHTCSECEDSFITFDDALFTEWSEQAPTDIDPTLVESKTESRFRELERVTSSATSMDGYTLSSSAWAESGKGTVKYVKEWPTGFDTANSLYSTYNNTPKTASETDTDKTAVSERQIGYLYFHWCAGTYTAGPINRGSREEPSTDFPAFHAFFGNSEPEREYNDGTTVCWQFTNGDCCKDSYWYFRVPVYEQSYTEYEKQNVFTKWGEWSAWEQIAPASSATREVETRTLYRYIDAPYGAHDYVDGVCSVCSLADDGSGCNHTYGTWKIESAAACTADGSKYRECTLCSDKQTEAIPALGHSYTAELVPANCSEYTYVRYTCSVCKDSYKTHTDGDGSWSVEKPNADALLLESKTESRYRDLDRIVSAAPSMDGYELSSTDWAESGEGTVKYVKEWPTGFDTTNSLYSTYNNTPKTASETDTDKTAVSEKQIGYLYFHWCAGTYTDGPINRGSREEPSTDFPAFHAFFGNDTPEREYNDGTTVCWQFTNGDCCKDSYWYFRVPVYEQSYKTYEKQNVFTKWGEWSEWVSASYTASESRQVETRTVYRTLPAAYGAHNYVGGFCTVCGDEQPAFVCEHEMHTVEGKCITCQQAVSHSYENGCCSVCGGICAHSFVSGICTVCGMQAQETAELSAYLASCTAYASNLIVKTIDATALMSYPCTAAVQPDAAAHAKVTADTTLFVKKLYKNTVGEYWYEVERFGKTYYVKAADTALVEQLTGDVAANDIVSPASLGYGASFGIGGTVTASLNELATVTVDVHSRLDVTKAPVMSYSDTASGSYSLAGSNIDNNIPFNNLDTGVYTYQISAEAKSYYIKEDGSLATASKTVDLHQKQLVVTDVDNPNPATGFGIDLSTWNDVTDWSEVAQAVDFIVLRASFATTADNTFIEKANSCVANDIPFGVYVYSYAVTPEDAVAEAEFVLSLVKNYDLALPIWFDFEDETQAPLSSSEKQAIVKAFCDTITEGGYQPGLYTFLSWFESYFMGSYYKQLPHWVAQIDGYTSNGTSKYTGGTHMWQYTWTGSISGINGDIDCNYCYAEFEGCNVPATYLDSCTVYPSYLDVTAVGSVEMRKYPCATAVDAGSTLLSTIPAQSKLVVTGLYENTAEELWYQVTFDGKTGYIPASAVTLDGFRYDDVTATRPAMASNLTVGSSYSIKGTLTSVYNEIATPFAKVYKDENLLATQLLTGSDSVSAKSYRVDGSGVDNTLPFNTLDEGYYTYELGADVKNYYRNESGTLAAETETVSTWVQPFTVGSSEISHTHSPAALSAVEASCTTTGLSAGSVCTDCGEILTEQTPLPALGHNPGAPVQENVIEGISYEEVIYCSVCDLQLSRKTVELTVCEHPSHDQSGKCTECDKSVEHRFVNGSCSVCELPCVHIWSDCTCTRCGLTVTPGTLSAVTLSGSFNGFATAPNMSVINGNTVAITLDLSAGEHSFSLLTDSLTFGNDTVIQNATAGLALTEGGAATTLKLTYDGSYTFTFNTDTKVLTLTADSVEIPGKLTVDVSGGNGFTLSLDEGSTRPQGNFYYNSKIVMGTRVTLTVKELDGVTFMGWMDMRNRKIVSTTPTYIFYTSGNDHFTAVYMQKAENVNQVVFVNDRTGQVLEMQYYASTDSIQFPSAPSSSSYTFKGWQYTEEQIKAKLANGEDVTVGGVWERMERYVTVTPENGSITASAGTNAAGQVLAYQAVCVTANAPAAGEKFAYWTDSDGNIKSYNTEYLFYPDADMTLTAVYVAEGATIDYKPIVSIDYVDTATDFTKNSFSISWDVPEAEAGITYVAAGILAVNKMYYKEETFVVGSTDVNVYDRRPNTTGNTATNSFVWRKSNVAAADVWVARAYVQYKDAEGRLHTVYTDLVEVTRD